MQNMTHAWVSKNVNAVNTSKVSVQNKLTCARSPVCFSVKKKEESTPSDLYQYFRGLKIKLNYFLINICAVVSVNDINSLQSDQFTFP